MRAFRTKRNFALAWKRLLRQSEPSYKWYWRPSAVAVNAANAEMLDRLRKEVIQDSFDPSHSCVLSTPKPTGLLRHYSLLSLGDQVVYQAAINIIADKMYPKVKNRYLKSIFGNLYAGPRSSFFYLRWVECYKSFNTACICTHSKGNHWVAQFDFASFYDSIDHGVLVQILKTKYQLGDDLLDLLTKWLKRWSSSTNSADRFPMLYLGHGIPQGPQPSALLSEVILSYLDEEMLKLKNITYLRYADDVRLFGKNEPDVRFAAAVLDRLSRNLGIFPQSKKFDVREVEDIWDILKTISLPNSNDVNDLEALQNDEVVGASGKDEVVLWDHLKQLLMTRDTDNLTQFKFLLGGKSRDLAMAREIAELIVRRPDLTETCCLYLEKCLPLDDVTNRRLLNILDAFPGYSWVTGRVLRLLITPEAKLTKSQSSLLKTWIGRNWTRSGIRTDPLLSGYTAVAGVNLGVISPAEAERWTSMLATPWWSIRHFVLEVDADCYGAASFIGFLQAMLSHDEKEVSRAAAFRLSQIIQVRPSGRLDADSQAIFKALGLKSAQSETQNRVQILLSRLVTAWLNSSGNGVITIQPLPSVDWPKLMQDEYHLLVAYCVKLRSHYGPNRSGFILELDAVLERIVLSVQRHKQYAQMDASGNPVVNKKGQIAYWAKRSDLMWKCPEFKADFPNFRDLCMAANTLRNRCEQPHAYNTVGGRPIRNRKIYESDVSNVLLKLVPAISDLAKHWPS